MNLLYDPEYHNTGQYHKDMGARERKEIVAWLRSHDFMALNDAADLIEAGEYLK